MKKLNFKEARIIFLLKTNMIEAKQTTGPNTQKTKYVTSVKNKKRPHSTYLNVRGTKK